MAVPLPARPQSPEGFYAINNQFQTNGPKGFSELKILANGDMFVRMDLPGVPDEGGMSVYHNRSEESVVVYAKAPKIHTHDSTERRYLTMTGIGCSCCAISSMTTHMSDGVFRLTLSKTRIDPNRSSCIVLGCSGFREGISIFNPSTISRNFQYLKVWLFPTRTFENCLLIFKCLSFLCVCGR